MTTKRLKHDSEMAAIFQSFKHRGYDQVSCKMAQQNLTDRFGRKYRIEEYSRKSGYYLRAGKTLIAEDYGPKDLAIIAVLHNRYQNHKKIRVRLTRSGWVWGVWISTEGIVASETHYRTWWDAWRDASKEWRSW